MDTERSEQVLNVGAASCWTVTQGIGSPLVLCHGGPGLWDYMGPVAALVDDLFRVHRYDQRGCGRSQRVGPYSVSRLVADLEALRRIWGHERWIVGGHSWGANLAIAYAARHPDRVTDLVYLSGTGLGWDWFESYQHEVARRMGRDQHVALDRLKSKRNELAAGSKAFNDVDKEIRRLQWATDFADAESSSALVDALVDQPLTPNYTANERIIEDWRRLTGTEPFVTAVTRISCPVLVVHGAQDPRGVSSARRFADQLSHASLEIIAGAGHYPWLEAPHRFEEVLRSFLSR